MFLLQKSPLPLTPIGDGKSNVSSSTPPLPTSNSTNPNPKEPNSVSPPPPLQPESEKNGTEVINTTEPISPPPANQTYSQDNGKLPAKLAPPPKSLESGKSGTEPVTGNPPPAKDPDKVNDVKGSSESASAETCVGKSNICRTENSLVACSLSIDKGTFLPSCSAIFFDFYITCIQIVGTVSVAFKVLSFR